MWMREHRNGATAMVTSAQRSGVYVSYATEPGGMVSRLVDHEALEAGQAEADRAAGCPQPCGCPPWSEVARSE
jgi:hypothetical protein